MQNLLLKLWQAKIDIASQKNSKEWSNDYSHYDYFTPEQVNKLVFNACVKNKLITKFDLKRNEYGLYGILTIYDIESWEFIEFEWASELPDIKATVSSQRYGWLMTYLERYLKMTAFWICDNSLDFDTTENTRKVAEKKSEEKDITKDWPFIDKKELPWFNEPDYEKLKAETEWLKEKETSDEVIKVLETKYRLSKAMKQKVAELRASI